jgi:hypothetical protein
MKRKIILYTSEQSVFPDLCRLYKHCAAVDLAGLELEKGNIRVLEVCGEDFSNSTPRGIDVHV